MQRQNQRLIDAIRNWPVGINPADGMERKAAAINLTHDQHIAPSREDRLAALMGGGGWDDLTAGYARYMRGHLQLSNDPADDVPEPFTAANGNAELRGSLDPGQWLVRIVDIGWLWGAAAFAWTRDELMQAISAVKGRTPSTGPGMDIVKARQILNDFIQKYNGYDRRPPSFAGLLREVSTDADAADWPRQLRDRYGIGKLGTLPGGPARTILQFRYKVGEVARRGASVLNGQSAFRVPTAFEANFYAYFFPAPTQEPFGCTVDLAGPPAGQQLTCEIIHLPVDMELADIHDIALLDQPAPDPKALPALRDGHLHVLRTQCRYPDFAEMMA